MLEVTKVTFEGEEFLKLKVLEVDTRLLQVISTINGWFKGNEPMVYGVPGSKGEELFEKTKDYMVVWKGTGDNMGSMVRGIDTDNVPDDYVLDYRPKLELRPYQKQLFNLLQSRNHLLVADQEGVGKTPPILCSHAAKRELGGFNWGLFVTKAGLVYDVVNQANKFTDMTVVTITGTKKKRINNYAELLKRHDVDLCIISYEMLRTDADMFEHLHNQKMFDIVYLDEAHKAKNVSSGAGKVIHRFDCKQKYAITATPIINEIADMQNILHWMGAIPYDYWSFQKKFVRMYGFTKKYINLAEIKSILQSNMIRRLKSDVLKDLPPVVSKTVYVQMTPKQKKLYNMVEEAEEGEYEFEDLDLEFEDIPSQLARYGRMAQVAESAEIVGGEAGKTGSGKLKMLEEMMVDIVARNEKAIVFTRSKKFCDIMLKFFKEKGYNPVARHGELSAEQVQANTDRFQEDPSVKMIICTESSSREGWTGTEGNHIIFTSKPWSPAYVSQCIGRAWRYGAQKHQSITVTTLVAQGTIDEHIETLLTSKQYTIDCVVETPLGANEVLAILDGGMESVA